MCDTFNDRPAPPTRRQLLGAAAALALGAGGAGG
ncbi:MAG: hypothetical protein RJA10_1572, partial [Pseudomonadota bacterium]